MRKYTQRELLEEGFWSGLGKGLVKTAKVADKVLTPVLPQVTRLVKDPVNYIMGIKNAATGYDPKSKDLSDKAIDEMEANLAKQGFTLDPNDIPRYEGNYNNMPSYSVYVTDSNGNATTLTVDKKGNKITTRTRSRNTRRPAVTPNATSTAPTTTPTAPTTPTTPSAPTTPPGNVVPFTRP